MRLRVVRRDRPVVVVGDDDDRRHRPPPVDDAGGPRFVRLSPGTARALHNSAAVAAASAKPGEEEDDYSPTPARRGAVIEGGGYDYDGDDRHFWTVDDDDAGGGSDGGGEGRQIDFLPLRIVEVSSSSLAGAGPRARVVYSSFNGGSLSPSTAVNDGGDEDDDGAIELPTHLFDPPLPTLVDVHPLRRVPDARRVEVEPLTVEDWELIECHAEFLEDGGWLNQISVVFPDQVVTLSLGGGDGCGSGGGPRDVARVRIHPESFRVDDTDMDDESDDYESGEDDCDVGSYGEDKEDDYLESLDSESSDVDLDLDWEGRSWLGDAIGSVHDTTTAEAIKDRPNRSSAGVLHRDDDDLIRYMHHPAVDAEEPETSRRNDQARTRRSRPRPYWRCLRLVRDTEVLVRPKKPPPRSSEGTERNGPSPPLRVAPVLSDVPQSMLDLWEQMESHRLGVVVADDGEDGDCDRRTPRPPPLPASPPPLCVHAHPETLSADVPGWGDDDDRVGSAVALLGRESTTTTTTSSPGDVVTSATPRGDVAFVDDNDDDDAGGMGLTARGSSPSDVGDGSVAVVRVHPSRDVAPGHVALHPLLGVQLDACPLYDNVRLRMLTCDEVVRAQETAPRAGLVSTDDDLKAVQGLSLSRVTIRHGRSPRTTSVFFPDEGDVAPYPLCSGGDRGVEDEDKTVSSDPNTSLLDDVRDMLISLLGSDNVPIPISSGTLLPIPRRRRNMEYVFSSTECICYVQLWFHDAHSGGSGTTGVPPMSELQAGRDQQRLRPDVSSVVIEAPTFLNARDLVSLLSRPRPNVAPARNWWERRIITAGGSHQHRDLFGMLPVTNPSVCGMEDATVASLDHIVGQDFRYPSGTEVAASADAVPCGRRHQAVGGGLILHGEDGAGKTHCALNIAALLRVSMCGFATVYLDCRRLQSMEPKMSGILSVLTDTFARSLRCSPSLLILDDLDALVPDCGFEEQPVQSASQYQQPSSAFFDQAKLVADHILSLRDEVLSASRTNQRGDVAFLCTCRTAKSVHASLRSLGALFDACVEVPSLGPAARSEVLQTMLSRSMGTFHDRCHRVRGQLAIPMDVASFGRRTEGYRPSDLKSVALRTHYQLTLQSLGRKLPSESVHTRDGFHIDVAVVEKVFEDYVPSSLQNARLSHPTAKWVDVGGLVEAKSKLIDMVLKPVKYSRIYRNSPVKLPRGLLLYGPPGCGKTLLASSLADLCGLNLVTCRGAELLDKYIGASEAKVREIFHRAAAASPSMILFDDFDALAPKRGADNTGVTDRVVNQLLTFLDGVETLNKNKSSSTVYVVAATSRPDRIDSALLRPGRLDKHVYVGFPETDAERTDILSTLAGNWNLSEQCMEAVRSGALLRRLRQYEDDVATLERWEMISLFSAADFKAVLDTAYLEAVHTHLQRLDSSGSRLDENTIGAGDGLDATEVRIDEECLTRALCRSNPSMSRSDREFFLNIYDVFSGNTGLPQKVGGNEQRKDAYGRGEGFHNLSWTRTASDIPVQETALR